MYSLVIGISSNSMDFIYIIYLSSLILFLKNCNIISLWESIGGLTLTSITFSSSDTLFTTLSSLIFELYFNLFLKK